MIGKRISGRMNLVLAAVLLALLTVCSAAAGEEAPDLTQQCEVRICYSSRRGDHMTDGDYVSYWESNRMQHPWVILTSDTPIYGLYLCFRQLPSSFELQTLQITPGEEEGTFTEEWIPLTEGDTRFQNTFYELPGVKSVRIYSTQTSSHKIGIFELYAFGKGEIPGWVQRWQETEGKADLMFFSAHPDDELLFYGGAIPTYAGEMKKRVVVAYLTYGNPARRTEALNGLWAAGVRHYPEFGGFQDSYSSKVQDAYRTLGKTKVLDWVTKMVRKHRPEVIVTLDLNGEYGHGQHRMMGDAAIQVWDLAADASQYPETAAQYGTWQVQKLYIHLYGDETNQTSFDWNVPLESFGGKTSLEVTKEAYALHKTQENAKVKINHKWTLLSIDETGTAFSNTTFGLYASRVGPDETHTDFLEHIGEEIIIQTEKKDE